MEDKYVVLDSNNKAINLIVWNGDTTVWQPPTGTTVIRLEDANSSMFEKEEPVVIEEDPQY
jgi:hypothetical protein